MSSSSAKGKQRAVNPDLSPNTPQAGQPNDGQPSTPLAGPACPRTKGKQRAQSPPPSTNPSRAPIHNAPSIPNAATVATTRPANTGADMSAQPSSTIQAELSDTVAPSVSAPSLIDPYARMTSLNDIVDPTKNAALLEYLQEMYTRCQGSGWKEYHVEEESGTDNKRYKEGMETWLGDESGNESVKTVVRIGGEGPVEEISPRTVSSLKGETESLDGTKVPGSWPEEYESRSSTAHDVEAEAGLLEYTPTTASTDTSVSTLDPESVRALWRPSIDPHGEDYNAFRTFVEDVAEREHAAQLAALTKDDGQHSHLNSGSELETATPRARITRRHALANLRATSRSPSPKPSSSSAQKLPPMPPMPPMRMSSLPRHSAFRSPAPIPPSPPSSDSQITAVDLSSSLPTGPHLHNTLLLSTAMIRNLHTTIRRQRSGLMRAEQEVYILRDTIDRAVDIVEEGYTRQWKLREELNSLVKKEKKREKRPAEEQIQRCVPNVRNWLLGRVHSIRSGNRSPGSSGTRRAARESGGSEAATNGETDRDQNNETDASVLENGDATSLDSTSTGVAYRAHPRALAPTDLGTMQQIGKENFEVFAEQLRGWSNMILQAKSMHTPFKRYVDGK